MPRVQPDPGFITAKEAKKILGVSDGVLSRYVRLGWLGRYGGEGRVYGFYSEAEVYTLLETRHTFRAEPIKARRKGRQRIIPATFVQAKPEDMESVIAIDKAIFGVEITTETYLRWLRKNPETFFVLKGTEGQIVGYAAILPLKQEAMENFISDKISMDEITEEDVELFLPGRGLSLYVIAVAVDPSFPKGIKQAYGGRLLHGIFLFLVELAQRGVEIETITARNQEKTHPDGLAVIQDIGMTLRRSPSVKKKDGEEEKRLYSVRVSESGYPALVRYSDALAEWKRTHQKG